VTSDNHCKRHHFGTTPSINAPHWLFILASDRLLPYLHTRNGSQLYRHHSRYVSSSLGDDSTARGYRPSDVGPDPFHPTGTIAAYRTITAAVDASTNGQPDWVLLRRGDSWENGKTETFPVKVQRIELLTRAHTQSRNVCVCVCVCVCALACLFAQYPLHRG
jgi:hypothetical protein